MTLTDVSWNFMDPAAKGRVLGVLKGEISGLFDLVADPERWQAPTACEHWEVRDVVGHLVDTTEGYLPAFAVARTGDTAPEPHGLRVMAELVDEAGPLAAQGAARGAPRAAARRRQPDACTSSRRCRTRSGPA